MPTVIDQLVVDLVFRGDASKLRRFESRVDSMRARLDKASLKFGIAGAAVTGALYKVGGTIHNFETEINSLSAATNASAEELAAMRAQALDLGRTTRFSASQVAAAQKVLGQAGLSTNKILETTPGVLRLAAAGSLGMAEAAGIAMGVLRGFRMEVGESSRVADILAKSATSARTEVAEMGIAIAKSAAFARELEIPLENTAAAVAVIQDNAFAAEEAGTGFRNVLMRLLNIAGPAKDAIKDLKVPLEDIEALMKAGRWDLALRRLKDAGMDATVASKIFQARTASMALILSNQMEKVDGLTTSLYDAGGAAEEMATRRMVGLPGALLRFQSQVEGAQLAVGEKGLTGALVKGLDTMGKMAGDFAASESTIASWVAGLLLSGPVLLGLGVAIKGVSFALGGLAVGLKGVLGLIGWMSKAALGTRIQLALLAIQQKAVAAASWLARGAVAAFRGVMLLLRGGLVAARTAMLVFNAAMLANPIGVVIVAVVALGAAVYALVQYWDEVVAAVREAWAWLQRLFGFEAPTVEQQAVQTMEQEIRERRIPAPPPPDLSGEGTVAPTTRTQRILRTLGVEGPGVAAPEGILRGELTVPEIALPALQAAPVPGPVAGAAGGPAAPVQRNYDLRIGELVVHAEGGDSTEIAQNIDASLRDQFQKLVEQADSPIAR